MWSNKWQIEISNQLNEFLNHAGSRCHGSWSIMTSLVCLTALLPHIPPSCFCLSACLSLCSLICWPKWLASSCLHNWQSGYLPAWVSVLFIISNETQTVVQHILFSCSTIHVTLISIPRKLTKNASNWLRQKTHDAFYANISLENSCM